MQNIRKAVPGDVDAVTAIYNAIHTEEEEGRAVIGWNRSIYPTRETARTAQVNGELYVMEENGRIVAAARINRDQEPAYASVSWECACGDDEILVLHTLVVDPACAGHGFGPQFVAFYEDMARRMGCRALRMDTNMRNARARKLYASLGYREAGIIPTVFNGIGGVQLVCLEKVLRNNGKDE